MAERTGDRCPLCGGPRDDIGDICAACRADNLPPRRAKYRSDWVERVLTKLRAVVGRVRK